jgi:hypothetical protein
MVAAKRSSKKPNTGVAHKPTDAMRKTVRDHAIVGTPQENICAILGISVPTLHKHYRQELDTARDTANAAIGGALYTKAMGGDTAAMIFWMKTRARWRETVDIVNSDGSLKPQPAVDLSKLSSEALAEIVAASDAAAKD